MTIFARHITVAVMTMVLRWQFTLDSAMEREQNSDRASLDFLWHTGCRVHMNLSETQNVLDYFAYGSNMNLPHLQDWLRRFGVEAEGVVNPHLVILPDYRIRTNYLTTSGFGAANIEPSSGDAVEGVLLTISTDVQDALRGKEGWPYRYDEIHVEVIVPSNDEAIQALTYRVTPEHRLPLDVPVSPRYRSLILTGAEDAGLSQEYQGHLCRILKVAPEAPISSPDDTGMGGCLMGRSPGDTSLPG